MARPFAALLALSSLIRGLCVCVRCEGLVCESPLGGFVICMGGYSTDRPQEACLPPALPPALSPALLSLHVEGLVELVHETGPEVGLQLGNRAGAVRKEQGLLRACGRAVTRGGMG